MKVGNICVIIVIMRQLMIEISEYIKNLQNLPDHVSLTVMNVEHRMCQEGAGSLEAGVEDGAIRIHWRCDGLCNLFNGLGALEYPQEIPQILVTHSLIQRNSCQDCILLIRIFHLFINSPTAPSLKYLKLIFISCALTLISV